jgi:hypothetical protein
VAAFYPLPRCLFYGRGSFHTDRLAIHFLRGRDRFEVKEIVYRMSEILFPAEIAFRCLDGRMPQQEFLLQLATAAVAQLRAGSPQIMRYNMLQACSLAAATLDDVPHDILRDAFPPYLSRRPGDGSKDPSLRDPGCYCPLIECAFTHSGMGTVRMWPPLPIRSTTAQCPWRIWISSNSRPTSSDLRKPQPNRMASMA